MIRYRVLYKRVAGCVYAQKLADDVVVETHELKLLISSWRKMAQQFMRHPGDAERLAFEWVKRVSGGGDSSALEGVEPHWYFRVEYKVGKLSKEKIVIATNKRQAEKKVRAFVKKETPGVAGSDYHAMSLRKLKDYEPIY